MADEGPWIGESGSRCLDVGSSVWVVGDIHGYRETFESLGSLCLRGKTSWCTGTPRQRPGQPGVMRIGGTGRRFSRYGGTTTRCSGSPSPRGTAEMMRSWLKYGARHAILDVRSAGADRGRRAGRLAESLPTQLVLRDFRLAHAGFVEGTPIDEQSTRLDVVQGVFEFQSPPDTERQSSWGIPPPGPDGAGSEGIWESPVRLKGGGRLFYRDRHGDIPPRDENPADRYVSTSDGRYSH